MDWICYIRFWIGTYSRRSPSCLLDAFLIPTQLVTILWFTAYSAGYHPLPIAWNILQVICLPLDNPLT
ncbi:unnamed protein product [Urochloa humidicola]